MPDAALSAELLAEPRAREGRSETLRDEITVAPLRNLSATLDRDDPLPQAGTELPPLWHWLYAVRPTFDLHPFRVNATPAEDGRGAQLWAQDHEGWLTMQAQAQFA